MDCPIHQPVSTRPRGLQPPESAPSPPVSHPAGRAALCPCHLAGHSPHVDRVLTRVATRPPRDAGRGSHPHDPPRHYGVYHRRPNGRLGPRRRSIPKLSILAKVFAHLCDEGLMLRQPVLRRQHRLLVPQALPKAIPDADLVAFFQGIDSLRDRLLFLLMLRCGLRVSEACALTWDAVDLQAGTVRINRGKGQVDRLVYFLADVAQAFQRWRRHHTPGLYVFPSPQRRRATPLPLPDQSLNGPVSSGRGPHHPLFAPLSPPYVCDAPAQCRGAPRSPERTDGPSLDSHDPALCATL